MITHKISMVRAALEEVCKRSTTARGLTIKDLRLVEQDACYQVTLGDGSKRRIPQEFINLYIESFGEKGALKITGLLLHSTELEDSAQPEERKADDGFWEGNLQDVWDYLKKKGED